MLDIGIFVLDRGFVVIGECELHPKRAWWWHLPRSCTIRVWGTTKGLSELQDGPTAQTVCDLVCERSIPERSIIDVIHLTPGGAAKWKDYLASTPKQTRPQR